MLIGENTTAIRQCEVRKEAAAAEKCGLLGKRKDDGLVEKIEAIAVLPFGIALIVSVAELVIITMFIDRIHLFVSKKMKQHSERWYNEWR